MSEPVAIDVQPLTPKRFADLAALFEEGGDPKRRWCTWQVGTSALRRELLRFSIAYVPPTPAGIESGRVDR